MGFGEEYYDAAYRMFSALTTEEQQTYEREHPEPAEWSGWYVMVKASPWVAGE